MPELALGTVQFGLAYGVAGRTEPVPEREVREILERASEAGIRRLDTAAGYGDIEERLACLVGDLPFEVVTKIPALPEGLGPNEAVRFVETSLLRSHTLLGTLLHGVLFHRAEDLEGDSGAAIWERVSEVADRLGIAVGISCYDPAVIQSVRASMPIRMAQLPGNALDQRLMGGDALPEDVEISLRSVFLQGLLLIEPEVAALRVPLAAGAIRRWHDWCGQTGQEPLTAALAVAKRLPGVSYCLVGVDSIVQLDEILDSWSRAIPITAVELAEANPAVTDPRRWAGAR